MESEASNKKIKWTSKLSKYADKDIYLATIRVNFPKIINFNNNINNNIFPI